MKRIYFFCLSALLLTITGNTALWGQTPTTVKNWSLTQRVATIFIAVNGIFFIFHYIIIGKKFKTAILVSSR